jgi:hypothetical protein
VTPAPFFIVGVPRSGTTLLTVLLNNHSEVFLDQKAIAIRTLNFSQRVERAVKSNPDTDYRDLWRTAAAKDERLYGFLDWDQLEKSPAITLGSFISQSFADRAKANGKQLFGDKSPDAIERLPELLSLFPASRLIVVVRDARPNVASLVRRQYLDLRVAAQRWKDWNAAGTAAANWLGPDRVLHVRYEDLLRKPEVTLQAVCTFLGVTYEDSMLDLAGASATQSDNAYVKKTLDVSAIDKWKNSLSQQDLIRIERICGDWLRHLGYEPATDQAGNANLGFWQDYRLRVANSFRLLFRPHRKEMRNQQLVDVKLPFRRRLYLFVGTLAGGIFHPALIRRVTGK